MHEGTKADQGEETLFSTSEDTLQISEEALTSSKSTNKKMQKKVIYLMIRNSYSRRNVNTSPRNDTNHHNKTT